MTKEEIAKILAEHAEWKSSGGAQGKLALADIRACAAEQTGAATPAREH